MTADEIIETLKLQPHPEGGYYRETFRDESAENGRPHSTAIHFLLKAGQTSRWHRVDSAEVFHWYAGAPLVLRVHENGGTIEHRLGNNLTAGERPHAVVPRGCWQMAESAGDWTLVGCTVAPGFLFEKFELAPEGWSPGKN